MRLFRIALLVLISATLVACTGYRRPPQAFHEVLAEAYRLDAGDRLRVVVFGQNNLSNIYLVDQSGHISMPLIGTVPARGKTLQGMEKDIATQLKKGYIRDPDVSVQIDAYRPFFIMGEVTTAGQYSYVAGMTVQTAIAIAGGFSPRANQRTVDISRQINGQIIHGRVKITEPIRPGDTIYVRERLF